MKALPAVCLLFLATGCMAPPSKTAPPAPVVKTETAPAVAPSGSHPLSGKWNGELRPSAQTAANDPRFQKAKTATGQVTLELYPDKTFSMRMLLSIQGTWSEAGDTITLKITKAGGTDMKQFEKAGKAPPPMNLTVSSDKKTLTQIPSRPDETTVVFTRA